MNNRVLLAACAVIVCVCAMTLEGQSQTPSNETPGQTNERGNPPSQNTTPSTTYEIFNAAPNEPTAAEEKGYGRQFLDNLFTDPIVWLTIAIAWLALVQLKVYKAEVRDTRRTERGYLNIAHTPDGWHHGQGAKDSLRLEIKNAGNTPVAVDRGYFRLVRSIENLKEITLLPTDDQIPGGFLVREKSYTSGVEFDLTTEDYVALRTGRLYVMGWVDYADAFGEIHRAGYARHLHVLPNNQIVLVWDRHAARFNYDQAIDRQGKPRRE